MLQPTELTAIGLINLKSAVLNVLAVEPDLKPAEISRRTGIPKSNIGMSYPIVRILLDQFKSEGRVVESHTANIHLRISQKTKGLFAQQVNQLRLY